MRRLLLLAASLAATTTALAAIPVEVTVDTGALAGTTGAGAPNAAAAPPAAPAGAAGVAPRREPPPSEDCLYLNVWATAEAAGDRQPVMVWPCWVNFARSGDPNGAGLPAWPPYRDAAGGKAPILGDNVAAEVATTPAATTLAFFDLGFQQLLKGGANQ